MKQGITCTKDYGNAEIKTLCRPDMKTNDIFRDPRPGNASGGTLAPRPGRGIHLAARPVLAWLPAANTAVPGARLFSKPPAPCGSPAPLAPVQNRGQSETQT
jgi:hypothetical protein